MKPFLKNPVMSNPWISKMPNNFRGCTGAAMIRRYFNFNKSQPLRGRPRRIPKAIVTQLYVEQLRPLYPHLTKGHVKAALTLSDNNMHESRLLLDMKLRFMQMRRAIERNFGYTSVNPVNSNRAGDDSLSQDRKSHRADDSFSTVTVNTSHSNSFSGSLNNSHDAMNEIHKTLELSAPNRSSSFATVTDNTNHSPNVYDFSDSESEPGSAESWFAYRRELFKRSPPNRKIGVVITRCEDGYKAGLL